MAGHSEEVCYGQLGCFTNDPPHDNVKMLPDTPDDIDTVFVLYTRLNPDEGHIINREDPGTFIDSHFNPSQQTVFQIHGWKSSGKKSWNADMKNEFLKYGDMNVIVVDWEKGSAGFYPQCVANSEVVGAEIDALLNALTMYMGLDVKDVYLVGHSLGAHVAGYAGERNPAIGRITGLDAAAPLFEGEDSAVRLDPSDAQFVDVIHSAAGHSLTNLGIGMKGEERDTCNSGHVDFYPNGGSEQPGCLLPIAGDVCDHKRGRTYFIESINQCPFTSYPCELGQWEGCDTCGAIGCSYMGFHAKESDARGVFYLETNSESPYCQG
ncbi:pancreatic lipase-related protein 2-like [Saccoglossus kowalevskii]|uniref:Pancreatic lipase-related protein 2-like n=1 Tax=Saccoglossus kowalevskii TaxID=10224 RepID=A0ABM0MZK2_SACKO|nr:PREDICTED: pancreatic lipase-related protein 2-like [Saccoglossus kowalevskii]